MRDTQTFERKLKQLIALRNFGDAKKWEMIEGFTQASLEAEEDVDLLLSAIDGVTLTSSTMLTSSVSNWIEAYGLMQNVEPMRSAIDRSLTRSWKLQVPKRDRFPDLRPTSFVRRAW